MSRDWRFGLKTAMHFACAFSILLLALVMPAIWLKWELRNASRYAAILAETRAVSVKKTLDEFFVRFEQSTSTLRVQDLQGSTVALTARLLRAEPIISPASNLFVVNGRGSLIASSSLLMSLPSLQNTEIRSKVDSSFYNVALVGCNSQTIISPNWALVHFIQTADNNNAGYIGSFVSYATLEKLLQRKMLESDKVKITIHDVSGCELFRQDAGSPTEFAIKPILQLYISLFPSNFFQPENPTTEFQEKNIKITAQVSLEDVTIIAFRTINENFIVIGTLVLFLGIIAAFLVLEYWVGQHQTSARRAMSESTTQLEMQSASTLAKDAPPHQLEAQLGQAQKMQAVGHLAAGIAHDFNNLLTAVLGAADEIAARAKEADILEDANQIRTAAERGASLVRQLLAFGRQQDLQPQVVDVNVALTALSNLLRRLLGGGVRLELALEPDDCRVLVDPTQFDQVLVNLAVNARDAMTGRGVLAVRSGQINMLTPLVREGETIPPGRYVTIEVSDTGCGIAPELLPSVFDPFFTTKREQGGSGLGLSTVHGIIRQSGGSISIESKIGVGTQIRIYLPHCGQAEEAMGAPDSVTPILQAASKPGSVSGILVLVDDEDSLRRLAERALTRQGWSVIAADSAEEALKLLEKKNILDRVQVIVTDLAMPGIDGLGLIRTVREMCNCPTLPAVLVSGYVDPITREALLRDPATKFFSKPYSLSALLAAVSKCAGVREEVEAIDVS